MFRRLRSMCWVCRSTRSVHWRSASQGMNCRSSSIEGLTRGSHLPRRLAPSGCEHSRFHVNGVMSNLRGAVLLGSDSVAGDGRFIRGKKSTSASLSRAIFECGAYTAPTEVSGAYTAFLIVERAGTGVGVWMAGPRREGFRAATFGGNRGADRSPDVEGHAEVVIYAVS